jgi:hypothetical protein
MAWKTSTSTDYVDLLNDLVTFMITEAAASAVPAAGGSSYVQNDKITLSGGTFGTAAVFNVDTVDGGGAVLTVSVDTEGDYTATPSNPVSTTGGTGSGCTLTVTWKAKYGWVLERETQQAVSAVVAAGGTGYSVNDKLTLVGGTFGTAAIFNVDTLSGSAVATVSLDTAGDYRTIPGNPVSTTVAPAGGSGCTLTVTWAGATGQDKEVILKGNGSGSDEIFCGVRTFQSGSARNWELAGFTGYSSGLDFTAQPGITPGRYDGTKPGAYVPLTNSTITYWFYVDSYHVKVEARMGSTYTNAYMGWLDRYATASEYPYPMLIMGCSSDPDKLFSSTASGYSGMCDPNAADADEGPGWVRTPGGTWQSVQNTYEEFGSRNAKDECVVYPCGDPDEGNLGEEHRPFSANFITTDFVPNSGHPGVAAAQLLQTPDSPNDVTILWPAILVWTLNSTTYGMLGEMRGVYWINALTSGASIVTEDTISIGGDTYKVFQNCNRTDHFALFCIKQE